MRTSILIGLLLAVVLLAGCGSDGSDTNEQATEVAPEAIFTAAAQTAAARLQERLSGPATPSPAQPSPTPALTNTPAATATFTQPAPQGTPSAPPTSGDRAEFVADVTVPDGTNYTPGQSFVKTWRLINNGTTTWDTQYVLVFSSGTAMNGPAQVNLPAPVAPNQTVDISVNLVSPASPGNYRGYWILKNPQGQIFGVGPSATEAVWVEINVVAGTPVSATPGTPTATLASPTTAPAVSQVALSVDSASATTCPHTFTFNAQFTLSQPATVTYALEAAVSDPGVTITLPAPSTFSLPAGTHTASYTLSFSTTLNGTALFRITAPTNVASNTVNFTLNCP